jgi:hypothetical protein
MPNATTHFEQIPLAQLKKKIEEQRSDEAREEAVTRESPAEKAEPYSVSIVNKSMEPR